MGRSLRCFLASLAGLAAVIAVIRADPGDLPNLMRAIRRDPRDDKRDTPPSLTARLWEVRLKPDRSRSPSGELPLLRAPSHAVLPCPSCRRLRIPHSRADRPAGAIERAAAR